MKTKLPTPLTTFARRWHPDMLKQALAIAAARNLSATGGKIWDVEDVLGVAITLGLDDMERRYCREGDEPASV